MKQFSVCFTQILRETNEFSEKEKECVERSGEMNNVQIISLIVCFMMEQHINDDVNEHIHIVSFFMNDCEREDEQECDPFNADTSE